MSPYLSNLVIVRSDALCEGGYAISFHFDDPQGDVKEARMTPQKSGEKESPQELYLWPEDQSGRSSGTVEFPLSFTCDSPGGRWTISVDAVDDREHTSNTLSEVIEF